ncbi:hypothetical protein AAG570_005912 [Ranatra chinensis]|uniref:EF-hand domain-containing protein n=1 Tax=Ranatra chinensis TaxID=642074 RepID=A0ABD0XWH9_9HEMI
MLYNTFGVVAEDEVLLDRIFCTFDTANDGVISLQEWVLALSVFLKGTLAERAGFTFSVYDLNNDGYIVKDEMLHWLRNSLVKQPQDEDPDEGVKDLVDMVLKRLDLDRDGKVSKEDFLGAVAEEPLFLEAFGQCLPTEAAAAAFLMTLAP